MQRLNKIILTAVLLAPMACSSDNGKTGPDVKPVVPPVQKETGIEIGKVLPAWQKGEMDIHFINTTTGECAFLMVRRCLSMLPVRLYPLIQMAVRLIPASVPDGTPPRPARAVLC